MNDPNGMVYHQGEYHLFHQWQSLWRQMGHMSWGHAVSSDLVHWHHLPVALAEEGDLRIYSGSAVVDFANSSGFGTGGPPLVAIYTGHREESSARQRVEDQRLAYSNDRRRGRTTLVIRSRISACPIFAIRRSSGTSRRSAGSWP
jgi:fructan beta-fructosidase